VENKNVMTDPERHSGR